MENTSASGICMTLRVLLRILQGMNKQPERAHEHLLFYHLIPLHRPSSMVLWRDQTSLLELYHEPLVQCIAILLQKRPLWIPNVISAMLEPEVWPKGGNTPKLVLLLHEIDTYIGILPSPVHEKSLGDTFRPLLLTLGRCMASDNSRLAERALTLFKNKTFMAVVELNFEQSLSILLPFLVRREPAWNPTVRKITYHVLKSLKDFDQDRFLSTCTNVFPNEGDSTEEAAPTRPKGQGTAKIGADEDNVKQNQPKDFGLNAGMGTWRPPSSSGGGYLPRTAMMPPPSRAPRGRGKGVAPPLTVTGVAPWAINRPTPPSTASSQQRNKNPPLGVTGVAPWAMQMPPVKRSAGEALIGMSEDDNNSDQAEKKVERETGENNGAVDAGQSRVLSYMEKIKPDEDEEGSSSWSKAQMAETPTLLPKLKFHDLVFGHELGHGAFGSVKYARLIDRSRTRSNWPEYAVKVVSTEKIKELGYEASVQREVAVLRILSHPGIARLASSFRFREGVYLVLEYASGGDLHSLLRKNGSLDHDSTRFVTGEVVAALASIHDMGLVYGDLKPENIVITELGHIKLTDFGGCRPVTVEAKQLIESSARNLLKQLRDGDWKSQPKTKQVPETMDEDKAEKGEGENEYEDDEDIRVEGTTAYLPPEVVMGAVPTIAADSWALGCVLYQCLSGRPPILEADDDVTRHRIVCFDATESDTDDGHFLFQGKHAASIDQDARNLILRLLSPHDSQRPSMNEVAQHDFFEKAGTDVFSLYRQPSHPLDVGDVSPVADAQWSRRQFSSIWSPQPQAYDISINVDDVPLSMQGASSGPIQEGEEATAFFSRSSTHPANLLNIAEKIPLPTSRLVE
jgi:serine/threonine protein kinase